MFSIRDGYHIHAVNAASNARWTRLPDITPPLDLNMEMAQKDNELNFNSTSNNQNKSENDHDSVISKMKEARTGYFEDKVAMIAPEYSQWRIQRRTREKKERGNLLEEIASAEENVLKLLKIPKPPKKSSTPKLSFSSRARALYKGVDNA